MLPIALSDNPLISPLAVVIIGGLDKLNIIIEAGYTGSLQTASAKDLAAQNISLYYDTTVLPNDLMTVGWKDGKVEILWNWYVNFFIQSLLNYSAECGNLYITFSCFNSWDITLFCTGFSASCSWVNLARFLSSFNISPILKAKESDSNLSLFTVPFFPYCLFKCSSNVC